MAEFKLAYEKVIPHEIGYSDHPNDKGGESYNGISRVHHPDWEGWPIIDWVKGLMISDKLIIPADKKEELEQLCYKFYEEEFWNKIKGSEIKDQLIATELFDIVINMGIIAGIKLLQQTINLLNRNQGYYNNIKTDGIIGPVTLATLNKSNFMNGRELVFNVLNFYQAKRYIELMETSEDQEVFIGWFNRIEIRKRK